MPRALSWFVMGGGLTRSPGQFFMLLTLAVVIRLYESVRRVDFFFSSRRRHTRCSRDWSSDVCSSDLSDRTDTLEYKIVDRCFDALGKRKLPEIARALSADIVDVQEAIAKIALLEPNPGRDFVSENQQYVVPEIFVTKVGEEYVVSNNNDQVPHLRISNHYKDLMAQAQSSPEVREWIRDKIRAGKFLIKSLHQRQETILNIAREIVKRQREFLEKGVSALRPMTMVQVAEVVGVHETTVSRAVSGKYMETPLGVFEMKYFFTSGIRTHNGEGMSNTSVKEMINEMISKEDVSKPLSDEEIVKQLASKGVVIARRTVAKYRSELNILPSHLRKQYRIAQQLAFLRCRPVSVQHPTENPAVAVATPAPGGISARRSHRHSGLPLWGWSRMAQN